MVLIFVPHGVGNLLARLLFSAPTVLLLKSSIKDSLLPFGGKISWVPPEKNFFWSAIQRTSAYENERTCFEDVAIFNGQGSQQSMRDRRTLSDMFCRASERRQQYSRIKLFINKFWEASKEVFGWPESKNSVWEY